MQGLWRHCAIRLDGSSFFVRAVKSLVHIWPGVSITKVWPGPTSRNHSTNQKAANTHTHTHTERERERECSVVCAAAYTLLNVEVVVCDDAGHEDQIDDNNNNLYGKKVFCSIAKPVIMISCSFWIVCVIYLFYFFFSWIFPSTITITATALKLQYCLLPSLSENDDRWLDRTTVWSL